MSRRCGMGIPWSSLANDSTGSVFVMSRPQANAKGPTAPDRNAGRGGTEGLVQASRSVANPRMSSTKEDPRVAPTGPCGPPRQPPPPVYFSSTTAPCASSFFLMSSASCLDTPSFTVPGAPSILGLKEAKALVEGAPGTGKEGGSKQEAADIKKKIEAHGAVGELKEKRVGRD